MRLTLRTLLAYRDGVLSATDFEDLHRRIQQSPDAGNLLRRINELTANSSLPTPKLQTGGLGSPNVIAEYLDDVLTSSRIAELERLCLEYNEHLCELAHCHHMLAQAMNAHVEVSDELQQKANSIGDPAKREELRAQLLTQSRKRAKLAMVAAEPVDPNKSSRPEPGSSSTAALANLASPALSSVSAATVSAHPTAIAGVAAGSVLAHVALPGAGSDKSSSTPVASVTSTPQQVGLNLEGTSLSTEVPEYLLGSRKRRWQIPAAILALTALLFLLVLQSIGSWENLKALMVAENTVPNGGSDSKSTPEENGKSNNGNGESSKATNGLEKSSAKGVSNNSENATSPKAAESVSATTEGSTNSTNSRESAIPMEDKSAQPGDVALGVDAKSKSTTSELSQSSSPPTNSTQPDASQPSSSSPAESQTSSKEPDKSASIALKEIVWRPVDENESQSALLLRTEDGLRLLSEDNSVFQEGQIIAPPVARSTLQAGPWSLQIVGPTVAVLSVNEGKLSINSSRMRAIVSSAEVGAKLTLRTSSGVYEIRILDKAAWLGIEVGQRVIGKGSIIEPTTFAPTVVIVAGADSATTNENLARVIRLDEEQVVTLDSPLTGVSAIQQDPMILFALQTPPTWYRKRSVRPIDQIGMADFCKELLNIDDSLRLKLRGLAADQRPEVAALAIQTSMMIGDWQPLAGEMLSNDRMRSHWTNSLDLARSLIAQDSSQLTNVQAEFQSKFGADADRAVELLVGLSAANQIQESLTGLVKGLDSNSSLPIRIITAHELRRLTGEELGYQPHSPVRAIIQQWRSSISSSRVSFLPITDPIYERNPRP